LPKLKPPKPAKGWSWEGVGERVSVGEADVEGDVGVVLLRGDCALDPDGLVEEFEKTVRSFWRERAGERRREGMVAVAWCGLGMVVFGLWR
jgi:hypothetical protein